MTEKHCKDCAHYRQHYILSEGKLFRIRCGHCTFRKARTRRPEAGICLNYTEGVPDEDAFVSKAYLSKKLLNYFLGLELLPEIRDGELR